MLTDVIEGLKLVAEGIENVQKIAEAVKSGKDYLKTNHAEAQSALRAMIGELSKSVLTIKKVSAVLTNYRFSIATDSQGAELARFNEHFISSKDETERLRQNLENLRTHCSKVRKHAGAISESVTAPGLTDMFRDLLGLRSPEKEKELGEKLDKLSFEDFAVANSANQMLECLELALQDVQNTLGNGGAAYPENIPAAAALLRQYGLEFAKMEDHAVAAIKIIQEAVDELK